MRYFSATLFLIGSVPGSAQVELNTPLRFTGPVEERTIEDVAAPRTESAILTVEASLLGTAHWGEATQTGNALTLLPTVQTTSYRIGQLFRFLAPGAVFDSTSLRISGLEPYPLRRPDGVYPVRGQVRPGAVCEVLFAGDHWVLLNLPERGCPTGTFQLNDRLCMERVDAGNLFFYAAAERCAGMGARLCGWDEYYYACSQHAAELSGLFDAWEWIDDASNHANSAVQVGFANCTAQRWANPQSVTLGHSRCCFEPR